MNAAKMPYHTTTPRWNTASMTNQLPAESDAPVSRRRAVIGLIVVVIMVLLGLLLVHVLHRMSQIQDCAMAGRSNCVPIDLPPGTN